MAENLSKLIEAGLKNNESFADIKTRLVSEGHIEKDIDSAARQLLNKHNTKKETSFESQLDKKIILDRIGYGFSSNQFINILFSFTGASLFMIGLINAVKSSVSTLLSGFLTEYGKEKNISKNFIRSSGLLFGFSFLFLALGVAIRSDFIFALSLLLGSIGVVSYGDSFQNGMMKQIGKMRFSSILSKFAFLGLVITALSILLSGYIMQTIPVEGRFFLIDLSGYKIPYKLYGYLIAFFVTALTSILSAHILARFKVESNKKEDLSFSEFIFFYIGKIKKNIKVYYKNRYLFVVTLATLIIAIFQSALGSFVGIHIYYTYLDVWLGGFLNVAVIFAVALLASYLGPIFASKLKKHLGLAPMFVFGSLLMVIFPLTIVFNPSAYFPAVLVSASLSVMGVSIIGTGQSLLASRMLNENERRIYYATSGVITVIPFLVVVGLLAGFAQANGIIALFKLISLGAIILLVPTYLVLVFWSTKKKL